MGCGGSRATYIVYHDRRMPSMLKHIIYSVFVEHSFLVGWSTAYSLVHSMPRPKAAHRSVKTLSLGHEVSGKRYIISLGVGARRRTSTCERLRC